MNNEQAKKETKQTISFTIASKQKNPVINLTKDVKNLYNENYKILKKETEEDTKRWKDLPCSWIAELIL
jgi:uncharacterized protein (DUF608 family)